MLTNITIVCPLNFGNLKFFFWKTERNIGLGKNMSDKSFVFYWHVITTHCKYTYNSVAHESNWIIINTFYKYIIYVV